MEWQLSTNQATFSIFWLEMVKGVVVQRLMMPQSYPLDFNHVSSEE